MNNSFNETECMKAGEIYRSVSYNVVLGILIIVNSVAVFIVLKAVLILYKAKSFHFNLRWLIINIAIAILVRTSLTTTRAIIRIVHVLIEDNPCNFLSTKLRCTAESTLQSFPLETTVFNFPFVCLERFIATILNEKYEKQKSFGIVFIAIIFTWLYPIYTGTMKIMNEKRAYFVAYCSSVTDASTLNYEIFFSFYFEFPFFCFVICSILYFYCKYKKGRFLRKHSTEHSLTARYQLTEIMKTTRFVVPLCLVFCLLMFFQILMLAMSTETFNIRDLQPFSVIKEISSLLVAPIYALFFGSMFYLRHRLSNSPKFQTCSLGCFRKTQINQIPNQTDAYFQIYANEWK